jgi:hypothetical protein
VREDMANEKQLKDKELPKAIMRCAKDGNTYQLKSAEKKRTVESDLTFKDSLKA